MKEIISEANRLIGLNKDLVIATVISRDGSAPRGAGAKMIVKKSGEITGTIGGGLIEAEVISEGIDCIKNRKSTVRRFVLTKEHRSGIDMTCGGEAKILIQFIDSSDPHISSLFIKAAEYTSVSSSLLVTDVRFDENGAEVDAFLISEENPELTFRHSDLIEESFKSAADYRCYFPSDNEAVIIEALGNRHCVYICGGGHVGLKTAEAADLAGFDTVIFDDRPEFADPGRFPNAREVCTVEGFNDIFSGYSIGPRGYIVILTRGHSYDEQVLRQALDTDAGYIGMMGSRKKIDTVYKNLKAGGISETEFEKVFAPIGLDIGAETPAEIAVSIVAQLIKVKTAK